MHLEKPLAELRELQANPELVPAVVEETLRFESPVQAFGRSASCDLEIDGTHIPAGSSISIVIGAAHRDPLQFENPDRFDIHRKRNRHIAFGGDAHVCLGSTLARLEGQLAIAGLVARFPHLRQVDEVADWGTNFAFRGLRSLRAVSGAKAPTPAPARLQETVTRDTRKRRSLHLV